MSGLDLSSQSQSCASRARMPLTFQVATFTVGSRERPSPRRSAAHAVGHLRERARQRRAAERFNELRMLGVKLAQPVEDAGVVLLHAIGEILNLRGRNLG